MIGLLNANALHIPLADCSVQMVATSPPYLGLRDYKTGRWEGGDAECDHNPQRPDGGERANRSLPPGRGGMYKDICGKCGAVRIDEQLGLESLHDCLGWATRNFCGECYVCHTLAWAREMKRVLRDDGTFWVNFGDSYATSQAGNKTWGDGVGTNKHYEGGDTGLPKRHIPDGIKQKDLIGIPWRCALALQADGWYLRSFAPWIKRNSMPESATDRPTCNVEYIFLLSKSAEYYYDSNAVKIPSAYPKDTRRPIGSQGAWELDGRERGENGGGKPYDHDATTRNRRATDWFLESWQGMFTDSGGDPMAFIVNTVGFAGAHFATWPPKLVEPMIKAGSRKGDIVLDPFVGSGTTLEVARKLSRSGIGLDLSFVYLKENATKRLELDKLKKWTGK